MSESVLPTFSVTAMMREEPEVVQRFVDFYRAAGAETIFVYFDGPVDLLAGLDLAGVELIECNEAFWQKTSGGRPAALAQGLWATHTRSANHHGSDWLLIVDADEFLTGGSIRDMLAHVPGHVESLRVRNVEAVWGPGDDITKAFGSTHFRRPMPRRVSAVIAPVLYGPVAAFFNRGLVGHSDGKHFLRRGAAFTEIGSHDSFHGDRRLGQWAHEVVPGAEDMVIVHYDAVGFERWREKWRRRFSREMPSSTMSPKRAAQMPRIEAAISAGEAEALALFQKFYGLSRVQKAVLLALGRLERHDVFGRGASARQSGKTKPARAGLEGLGE